MAVQLVNRELYTEVDPARVAASEPRKMLSVICPVYNEETGLEALHRRISKVMDAIDLDWELILVDDGSSDQSAAIIQRLNTYDDRVQGIRLSRNFGFQVAVTAGLDAACGDAVILMDADLQDPPEVIPQMVTAWLQGADVVYGVRTVRDGETWFKKASASAFYRVIHRITNVDIPVNTGDFRLMDRRVVDAIRQMPERHRFLRGMVSWVGYKQVGISYHREARYAGSTKFTLGKMIRFALDAITGFSYFPLQIASWLGFAMALLSALAIIFVIGLRLFGTDAPLSGQATTLIAVLFLGSIQLLCMGIIGEYLGRMYDEAKARPLYLIQDRWGSNASDTVLIGHNPEPLFRSSTSTRNRN